MINDTRSIAAIVVGQRHRKELGDLNALAQSIAEQGLLQPVGIDENNELVFGERRLLACRDILKWEEIPVRVVNVTSIADGEYAENEIRKDFTLSERAAIFETIERKRRGRQWDNSLDRANNANAMKMVGFSSRGVGDRVRRVVRDGAPELVDAMEQEEISVDAAYVIASQTKDTQCDIIQLPGKDRQERVRQLRQPKKKPTLKKAKRQFHKITIPWSPQQAATMLINRWPRSLVLDLIAALQTRIAGASHRHCR